MDRQIDLMIVGAQKAGTTSLFDYLAQHPEIYTHPHREFAYFLNDSAFELGYSKAFAQYFNNVPTTDGILLAKHVMLMYSETAIKRLYNHNPNSYIIVILRNPIERAYSAYWYARRRGWEVMKTFEDALQAEASRLEEGWYKWRNCAYVKNSIYDKPMKSLIDQFGSSHVHVFLSEDLQRQASMICRSIYQLSGVHQDFVPDVGRRHNKAAVARSEFLARFFAKLIEQDGIFKRLFKMVTPEEKTYNLRYKILRILDKPSSIPKINPDTSNKLRSLFKPHNNILSEIIGRDLSEWDQK